LHSDSFLPFDLLKLFFAFSGDFCLYISRQDTLRQASDERLALLNLSSDIGQ